MKLNFPEAYTYIVNKNYMLKKSGKKLFHAILRGCLKKGLYFSGARDCLLCGVPYIDILKSTTLKLTFVTMYIFFNYPEADACYKLNIQITLKLTLVTMYIFLY